MNQIEDIVAHIDNLRSQVSQQRYNVNTASVMTNDRRLVNLLVDIEIELIKVDNGLMQLAVALVHNAREEQK